MVEDSHIIRNQLDLRQHMGRDQHRTVIKFRQGFYQVADFMDAGRVQSIGGFIQDQNRRAPQQRSRKSQALFHSQ